MLIYANTLYLEPAGGPSDVIRQVAKWVSQPTRSRVDEARLAAGIRELKFKDGSTLVSKTTGRLDDEPVYPYLFSAQLGHRDNTVSGRKWITEVGIRQEAAGRPVECSLLLKTDEVSARVTAPIQVTRPKLVEQLLKTCKPATETPGLVVKTLDEHSARAFLHEVERERRSYPLVLISCPRNGEFAVEPERLRSVLAGLADVVAVPDGVDTFAIEDVVGRRHMAFAGGVNIVFPIRRGVREPFCDTVLLRAKDIEDLQHDGKTLESEVLGIITHRTNLPFSWRHVSPVKVDQAILHGRIAAMLEQTKGSQNADEMAVYVELLKEADKNVHSTEAELKQLQADFEGKEEEVRDLKEEIFNLNQTLSGLQANDAQGAATEVLEPIREQLLEAVKSKLTLQRVVDLMATLFADRLVFLDTAVASAKEADRNGSKLAEKACDLLHTLATGYWSALNDGKGDQHAKSVFGKDAYAANESDSLSNEGKRLRTFEHRGQEFVMEKHLKHGVKDSKAETLRIHFEWLPAEKMLVVGHCGKHLNF
jgi:hypothetical protein